MTAGYYLTETPSGRGRDGDEEGEQDEAAMTSEPSTSHLFEHTDMHMHTYTHARYNSHAMAIVKRLAKHKGSSPKWGWVLPRRAE